MRWVGALKGYLGGAETPFSEEAAEKEVQAELRRLLEQRTQTASSSTAQPGTRPHKHRPAGAPPTGLAPTRGCGPLDGQLDQ